MIVVTGARGVVGLPLCQRLSETGRDYSTVSRASDADIVWDMCERPSATTQKKLQGAEIVVHCAPIWLLPKHIGGFHSMGIRRLIVFSSTSVLSKQHSENDQEQILVKQLAESEFALQEFCSSRDMQLTILRPSMIYGYGRDENIMRIANFIQRYGFAMLAGKAKGLRQPVHADDLVNAVINLLDNPNSSNQIYNLAGGEVLDYTQMVERIFVEQGKKVKIFHLPVWLLRPALSLAAIVTRFSYTAEMADRMNQDLVYDNAMASADLGYAPQKFLEFPERDLPGMVKQA